MPKRKNKSKNRDGEKKPRKDDEDSNNPIAEIFIKANNSSSSDSSSSEDGSSSSDDSYYRKKRASKKKKKSKDGAKKSFRKLQDQIDLFQRNVDIKLNYLESLVQTLIKSQCGGPSTSAIPPNVQNLPTAPSPSVTNKSKLEKPLKVPAPDFVLSSTRSKSQSDDVKKIHLRDSSNKFDIPTFPITDYDFVFEWDQALTTNADYRKTVAARLNVYSVNFSSQKDFNRAKSIMFFMFQMELLAQFSWAGLHFQSRGAPKKTAFRKFIGIIALVRAALNYSVSADKKIKDQDLVYGIKDALKRAPDKLKQTGYKAGAIFICSDDLETSQSFKEEQDDDDMEDDTAGLLEEV